MRRWIVVVAVVIGGLLLLVMLMSMRMLTVIRLADNVFGGDATGDANADVDSNCACLGDAAADDVGVNGAAATLLELLLQLLLLCC